MPDEARLALAFGLALALSGLAVPLAIRVAVLTEFYDVPIGYKGHARATPYLGGAAVIAGFLPAALWLGGGIGDLTPIVACAVALLVVGTVDDRRAVLPALRILAAIGAGGALFAADLGFSAFDNPGADLALTVAFVLGVVNAYNLIDNIDGAAGTVAAMSAAGLGILCAIEGNVALGALSVALAGSCAGFLPWNLSRPARIFLGDGGSMAIGVVIAATIMSVPGTAQLGWASVLVAGVLVGIPALDTGLVVVSRVRRRARLYHGARDHLTHRLLARLGSARRVAVVLAFAEAGLTVAGALLSQAPQRAGLVGAAVIVIAGLGVIASLEWPRRAPFAQTSPV